MSSPDEETPAESKSQVGLLLERLGAGDRSAIDELLPLVYDELHKLASAAMRGNQSGHTLQPTAVLHEAFVRMVGDRTPAFESRDHFLAVAARAMRSVMVDHARAKGALKRKGGERIELTDSVAGYEERGLDLIVIDEALERLGQSDSRLVQVVELIFFGGMTAAGAAQVLGCTSRTVERDWRAARAFLRAALDDEVS